MIRPPPRSTLSSSSAASDVYKRQRPNTLIPTVNSAEFIEGGSSSVAAHEAFFYKYFAERHKKKPKPVKKDPRAGEDDDMDHLADEEAENFLRSLGGEDDDGEDDEMPDFGDDEFEEGFEPEDADEDAFEYEGGLGDVPDFDDEDEEEAPQGKKRKPKYAEAEDYEEQVNPAKKGGQPKRRKK
eukprot:TRINITY_DN6896_c0_g1_i1.p1 TRINITY_DN6896_c0_g1~~TRINITY_DN6896_c0_g1_i1.p1  ORF type:complete len:183 (+),score=67.39 TRINITY_DN6896_c0_g1_i1:86-634(+)